jgi:hypothetical protein
VILLVKWRIWLAKGVPISLYYDPCAARQNLIALGTPYPSPERLRAQVEGALAPGYVVRGYSAADMSFPPISPLVPPPAFEYR